MQICLPPLHKSKTVALGKNLIGRSESTHRKRLEMLESIFYSDADKILEGARTKLSDIPLHIPLMALRMSASFKFTLYAPHTLCLSLNLYLRREELCLSISFPHEITKFLPSYTFAGHSLDSDI